MLAGQMKYRLRLLRPVAVVNDYGEEAMRYEETRTARAERRKLSGGRSEEVGEHWSSYKAEFNIRDAHEVCENWRVEQLGGHLYTVTAVVPNVGRGMKTLVCERVND